MPKLKKLDQTRGRLLRAATGIFAKKGYSRTTVREIARAGKCNFGLVSYYFDGKENLYRAIFEDFFQGTIKKLESATARTAEGAFTREEFILSVRGNIELMLEEFDRAPDLKRLMQREIIDGFFAGREVFTEQITELSGMVVANFEKGKAKGYVRPEIDSLLACVLMNRALEGYVMVYQACPEMFRRGIDPIKKRTKFLDAFQEIFLGGILT